jgi:tetratricopeptide (TPR) repeat protein
VTIWGKKAVTNDDNPTLLAGLELYDSGDYVAAIPLLVDRARTQDHFAIFKLANALFEIGQTRAAIAYWELAISLGSTDSYNNLANRLKDERFFEKAYELYVLGAEAGSDDAMHSAGVVAFELGKIEEGKKWLHMGMEQGNLRCYAVLGKMLFDRGEEEEAVKVLEAGVAKSSFSCLLQLGMINHTRENFTQAKQYLNQALAIEPVDPREKHLIVFAHGLLAAIFAQEGDLDSAIKHAEIGSALGSPIAAGLLETLRPLRTWQEEIVGSVPEAQGRTKKIQESITTEDKFTEVQQNLRQVKLGHFTRVK